MEKLLINSYGSAISFNTESNAIKEKLSHIECEIYKVEEDGQVITPDEVIDVKKGEYVLIKTGWDTTKIFVKAVIISDPVIVHDLDELYKSNRNKDKEDETC